MANIVGLRRVCGAWKVLGFLLCGHISQETHTKMRRRRHTVTMTSADSAGSVRPLWRSPSDAALHILGQHVPQEVDVVETAIFRLGLSLFDTFTASAAILPLVRYHGCIVHYTSHKQ